MKNSNQFSNNFKTFPAIVMVDSVPSENTNEKQAISFLIILNISCQSWMIVITVKKPKKPHIYPVLIPSSVFSGCFDQVEHFLFPNILLKK